MNNEISSSEEEILDNDFETKPVDYDVKRSVNKTIGKIAASTFENSKIEDRFGKKVKRKLNKAYIKNWNEDIVINGFARCIFSNCNFISSNISVMQSHHKTCNGMPLYNENFCNKCKNYVASHEEFLNHGPLCRGFSKSKKKNLISNGNKLITSDNSNNSEKVMANNSSKGQGDTKCDEKSYGFKDEGLCCSKNKLSVKQQHSSHMQNWKANNKSCGKTSEDKNVHFKTIKRFKQKDVNEDCIIQPWPVLPKGQYMRRRPYTKQHKKGWITTLEKFKYVKCIFQNCYFIAMSLEDMICHFGYCTGDGSFAKFVCPHCKGRVTSEAILLKHIERSHNDLSAEEITENFIEHFLQIKLEVPNITEEKNENNFKKKYNQETEEKKSNDMRSNSPSKQSSLNLETRPNEINELRFVSHRNGDCDFKSYNNKKMKGLLVEKSNSDVSLKEVSRNPEYNNIREDTASENDPADLEERNKIVGNVCEDFKINSKFALSGEILENSETNNISKVLAGKVMNPNLESPSRKKKSQKTKSNVENENILENEYSVVNKLSNKLIKKSNDHGKEIILEVETQKDLNQEMFDDAPNIKKRGRKSKNKKIEETSYHVVNNFNQQAFNHNKAESNQSVVEENVESERQPKKRGRQSNKKSSETPENISKEVTCGKCEFTGTLKSFKDHNVKKHVGLGWIKGEKPVDFNDEKELIRLVKAAFKVTKKGVCELCQDVKRSFLGFVTHVQNCGKSQEEKEALKVECPHCSARCLKYSLPMHIKLSHSSQPEQETPECSEEKLDPSGKRRSALRAVSKFQDLLKEDDGEIPQEKYFVFVKGDGKLPKLNGRLNNIWYKLKREKKKIPCCHSSCQVLSDDVKEAKLHHFTCSQLPEKVFMCEYCEFYSVEECAIQTHVSVHRKYVTSTAEKKNGSENNDEQESLEENEENETDEDEDLEKKSGNDTDLEDDISSRQSKKRKRKTDSKEKQRKNKKKKLTNDLIKSEMDEELRLRQLFCKRENLENIRGANFYSRALEMTFEEECQQMENAEVWSELNTKREHWEHIPIEEAEHHFPKLSESVSVSFTNTKEKWRKYKRFEGDLIDGVPIMFTGGSVRSMSWCKVSYKRMMEKNVRQYLAVATAKGFDVLTNIQERSINFKTTILQIWDVGVLESEPVKDIPKFVLGIVHEGGEIWDLSWFPEDTSAIGSEEMLPRLGLLATASENGTVCVWSVCDPNELTQTKGLPIYRIKPIVKLMTDEDLEDHCLRLSVGQNGVIAGGYGNGILAVWNLKNISSPFSMKEGNCTVIKPHLTIQAHRTSITALTFRPDCSRFISTGGLDRIMKLWDLESPYVPVEQFIKELSFDNIWTRNWPVIIYNFDDVIKNQSKAFGKFVKSLPDRSQSYLLLENTCLSLSFSDWLNAVCGCNNTGDIAVRFLKSFIIDQKICEETQTTISSLTLEKLDSTHDDIENSSNSAYKDTDKKLDAKPKMSQSYDNVVSDYGLVVKDYKAKDKTKPKNNSLHCDDFPIRAINKVCFNPNYKSFSHIAAGYNCGLIRIQLLKEVQDKKILKKFFEKCESETL